MISIVLKIIIITVFLIIFLQDFKDRLVYWFLYPLIGITAYLIQLIFISNLSIIMNTAINFLLIFIMLTVGFLYSKFVMKKKFINEAIGIGDLLLMLFLCFAFSTVPFIILLVFLHDILVTIASIP